MASLALDLPPAPPPHVAVATRLADFLPADPAAASAHALNPVSRAMQGSLILGMAVVALVLTAINMFGGFAVTRRMLAMFRK